MAGEVERYRPPKYREPQRSSPLDPRDAAYQAGMELAQRMNGAEMARPDQGGDPFNHPFFAANLQQGQIKKETSHKRSVHYINEDEYILTEETTTTETFSFGNNIFRER